MTLPRPVIPGTFLFVTRRCTQRQFLLRPDEETNNAFIYCLGEATQRMGIDALLAQMMSNHYHGVFFSPHMTEVEFRAHFHKLMAKCQNALRGRWENMWSSEEPCVIETITAADLLEKLVYVACNPVLDGLVEKVHHWPGPNFVQALLTGKPMKATRPRHFFRDDGPMPPEVELALKLPDAFEHKQEFLDRLRQRIAEVEDECARERQRTGRRVLGRRRVLRQSWRDSPTTHEPRRELRPRVAARSKWARIAALQRNKVWQAEYRAAYRLHQAGLPCVFPYGTYQLRKLANVCVAPPPPQIAG